MSISNHRQIILDIETTGINKIGFHYEGHKIIEIGAIEIVNRRITGNDFHVYLNPNRVIDVDSFKIHGISNDFLLDKPCFHEIADSFLKYIYGTELIIHNASFDIGFLNYELSKLNHKIQKIENICKIIDSLVIARKIFPGKKNNLNALCLRYGVNNSSRKFHNALLDAKILAKIFLIMTSGQTSFVFSEKTKDIKNMIHNRKLTPLSVIFASDEEHYSHELYLNSIEKKDKICLWRNKY
ncbi:MAG: DNA polymerase III subunit epsilon [Pantoea sp. Brub]|nr:DNA polymerase III subunit epsilon [Pantoea sp. Brub]